MSISSADDLPHVNNSVIVPVNKAAPSAVEVLASTHRMQSIKTYRRDQKHCDTDEEIEDRYMSVYTQYLAHANRLAPGAEKVFDKKK